MNLSLRTKTISPIATRILAGSIAAFLAAQSAHAAPIIIDDGDAGYSTTGSWTTQGGFDPTFQRFNGDWQYENTPGGGNTALWNFTGLASGKYLVSAVTAWGGQPNLTTDALYSISDGGGAFHINQAAGPRNFDLSAPAGYGPGLVRLSNFNGYVPVSISDGTLDIALSNFAGANFLTADAIRLEPVAADVEKVWVIGNGDAGYSEAGVWNNFGDENEHNNGFRFGNGTATFGFTGLENGTYRILATWTAGGNRPTDVAYNFSTTGSSGTFHANQQVAPAGAGFEDVNWDTLFTNVTVTDGTISISMQDMAAGVAIADAVRVEKITVVPEPGSAALMLGGLAMLAGRRRKSK